MRVGVREFMKTALTCFALLVASGTTMAQQEFGLSDANVTRAVNELSGEMLECAVFFSVGAQCVRGHPDQSVPGVVSDVTQAFQDMLDRAVKTRRTAGLSDAAATARRNMVTDAMLKSMGGNCINIGVVLEMERNVALPPGGIVDRRQTRPHRLPTGRRSTEPWQRALCMRGTYHLQSKRFR